MLEKFANRIFILRGISGSGKSTIANKLLKKFPNAIHSERDRFYMENGVYKWTAEKMRNSKRLQLEEIENALKLNKDVIADSLHITHGQYAPLLDLAEKYNARPVIVNIPFNKNTPEVYAKRNLHGLDVDKIKNMMQGFEPGRSEKFYELISKMNKNK